MPNINLRASDIEGLLPALDSRQVTTKPHIIEGRNFVFTTEGPVSAFGTEFSSYIPLDDPEFVQTFRLDPSDATVFIFTRTAVYSYDAVSMSYIPLLTYDATSAKGKWSHARVGRVDYFSHVALNDVIVYNEATEQWKLYDAGFLPPGARYVTESFGRLVVLGSDLVSWSVLDNGEDLQPSLTTGAGSQETALVGGETFVVEAVGDGFLTYTAKGIMKSTYIGGGNRAIFRHRAMNTIIRAYNRFSVVVIDNQQHVVIDTTGIFITQGSGFTSFDPLFGEFLQNNLLKSLDPTKEEAIRLYHHRETKRLYVSISFEPNAIYNFAYVRQVNIDKWGIFNQLHNNFGELFVNAGANAGIRFGFFCEGGFPRTFNEGTVLESPPITDNIAAYFYKVISQYGFRQQEQVYTMPSVYKRTAVDERNFIIQDRRTAWYKNVFLDDDPPNPILADLNYSGLDSNVKVGLLRFEQQRFPDELTLITDVAIGAGFIPTGQEREDYNLIDGQEDWNVLVGEEDWGLNLPNTQTFDASIESTTDGVTIFDARDLELIVGQGAQNFYNAESVGIYHSLIIGASDIGEFYHVKTMDMSGNANGRL